MILRNPAIQRDSFLFHLIYFFLVVLFINNNPIQAQGIVGHVVETYTHNSIPQAQIGIYQGDSLFVRTISDSTGNYKISTALAGRVTIRIISVGYQDYVEPDIILDGYSTIRLENTLSKQPIDLPGITIVEKKNRASDFVRSITPDDMVLISGNFEDPVRVAHSQPGIVLLNDQANHLSMRGQAPVFNHWYLEGLQIVNPNHTNNAGTFSDLPTQYGGGVNMFSAQILGTTDVYSGVGSLTVDPASGATINMHLHETSKPEWRAKGGLIGLEFGRGSRLGQHGILDINLRYSFTGLLTDLGADFGGEKIGFYDGVISYVHQVNRHKLKLFTWAGSSKNEFDQVQPPEDREEYKDFFDIDYQNDILGAGGRYDVTLSDRSFLKTGFAYSHDQASYAKKDDETNFSDTIQLDEGISILSSFVEFSMIHSSALHSSFGIHFNKRTYDDGFFPSVPFPEESLGKAFMQFTLDLAKGYQVEFGGEALRSFQHDQWNGGYRAMISKKLNNHHKLFAGIRQSAGDAVLVAYDDHDNVFFVSRNMEAGWEFSNGFQNIQFNAYYQHMYGLPVLLADDAHYYLPDHPFMPVGFSVTDARHDGVANQYGIEGLWSVIPSKGWRFEINQAVYKSERGIIDQSLSGGRYDGRFTTHVSFAKEMIHEKNGKNRIWNFALRGILNGGLWEPEIDPDLSGIFNTTIAKYPGLYDQRLPAYKRVDGSLSYTHSSAKIRWQYKLDIQNLFSLTNIAYHYFDPFQEEVLAQEQLGIIPVLSVQASW